MSMRRLLVYVMLIAGAVSFIYPFLWMGSISLRPISEFHDLGLFSENFTLANYQAVFDRIPIGRAFINSCFIAGTVTCSVLFFSSLVGYSLAKLQFKGQGAIMAIVMISMMIPGQLTLIPLYQLIVYFGWADSYLGLIVPSLMSGLGILIFRQTFMTIPYELMEAARMEGASEFQILRKIFWPLAKPAIVIIGILTFMGSWNEVLWPMIVVHEKAMMTLPQMVVLFTKGGESGGQFGIEMAANMMLVLPIIISYSFFQKYFVEALASSGIKG